MNLLLDSLGERGVKRGVFHYRAITLGAVAQFPAGRRGRASIGSREASIAARASAWPFNQTS
jgi:hypothetical protein